MTKKSIHHLGALQKAIMEQVWELGQATVNDVRERLCRHRPLAYTTILSSMQKLEKMGWLRHRKEGRTYLYLPMQSREEEGAHALHAFINHVFNGDPMQLFQQLIEDERINEDDLTQIRKWIAQRRKEIQS